MNWIHHFQLFLFDLDGLLIDSETLYHQAFLAVMRERGLDLDWDYATYSSKAHIKSKGLREATYTLFPQLKEKEPNWDVIEDEIKTLYLAYVHQKKLKFLPGVERLLKELDRFNIKRVVVTNTKQQIISHLKKDLPLLESIPYWITRDHYEFPKPHPESYLKAIKMLSKEEDQIIGFEDSIRGMEALKQTKALPVMICDAKSKLEDSIHFPSFLAIPDDWSYRS